MCVGGGHILMSNRGNNLSFFSLLLFVSPLVYCSIQKSWKVTIFIMDVSQHLKGTDCTYRLAFTFSCCSPKIEGSCLMCSSVELLTCINYLDCITLSGAKVWFITLATWSGCFKWMWCLCSHIVAKCMYIFGMQMCFCSFLSTYTNKHLLTYSGDQV